MMISDYAKSLGVNFEATEQYFLTSVDQIKLSYEYLTSHLAFVVLAGTSRSLRAGVDHLHGGHFIVANYYSYHYGKIREPSAKICYLLASNCYTSLDFALIKAAID